MADNTPKPLTEFDLIARFFTPKSKQKNVVLGIGDDCAVLNIEDDEQLVISIDTAVEGRHFPASAKPSEIATRAFCSALSDLAAMGATPRWFTVALTMPQADEVWLQAFSRSLLACAQSYQCELVGGDTTQGSLSISIQVHGVVRKNIFMRRDSAKVGDTVFVTGTVGDGAAALAMLLATDGQSISDSNQAYLQQHFYSPQAQIKAGQALVNIAHAAIDISDGLLADLEHIARASEVDIDLDVDSVPLSPACLSVASSQEQAYQFALLGGDDYQLAFTVPAASLAAVNDLIETDIVSATKIGEIKEKKYQRAEVRCFKQGLPYGLGALNQQQKGYQHFAS